MSPIPVPMRSGTHDPLRRRGHEARARMDVHGLVRDCAKVPAPPARTLAGAARAAAPSRAGRERWKGRALAHAGCFSLRMHSDGSRLLRATWSTSPAVMICAVVPRVCRVCAACVRCVARVRTCRVGWGGGKGGVEVGVHGAARRMRPQHTERSEQRRPLPGVSHSPAAGSAARARPPPARPSPGTSVCSRTAHPARAGAGGAHKGKARCRHGSERAS